MRLFVAAPLTEEAKSSIIKLQGKFKAMGVKGHFTQEQNFHITLSFIGEYKNPQDVIDALTDIRFERIKIKLGGLGQCWQNNAILSKTTFGEMAFIHKLSPNLHFLLLHPAQ